MNQRLKLKKNTKFIPKSLSIENKERIILKYLESPNTNLNYVRLIENAKNKPDFIITDKTRLKAKRLHKIETDKLFADKEAMSFGVRINFSENATKLKEGFLDDNHVINYIYNSEYIKKHNNPYQLFKNFKILFEFTDIQNRINLVSKASQIGLFEKIIGIKSQHQYLVGSRFKLLEMSSQCQIYGYNKIINELNIYLEDIINIIYTKTFQEIYDFANNARFIIPTQNSTFFEKIRVLAPEFESILKQYKLYVEDGEIDFDLIQISSSPTKINNIPSLIQKKYIYLNNNNNEIRNCINLFFSDQAHLCYIEPFKEEKFHTLYDLILNNQVNFDNYKEYQKSQINFLIDNNLIVINHQGFIEFKNPIRLLILKDLHDNELASFYRYPIEFQKEALKMLDENIIYFESSLFSKPEQSYLNYYLNKSEFTNGLDLRNSYLHGTQANPEEFKKHEYTYFTYLKLVILTLLKIDDELEISKTLKT